MKKILMAGLILFMSACMPIYQAKAEINLPDLIDKIPTLHQSVIFSLDENKFDYATSITLISLFDKKVNIDLGYSPTVEVLGLVSFKLVEAKNYITFPILDNIVLEPFIYIGTKRIENLKEFGEYSYGVGAKLVSLKF